MLSSADIVIDPVEFGGREPAPPLPTGRLDVDAVPVAHKPQPVPIVRVLMPVIMVAAMAAMIAVMFVGGRDASPAMAIVPIMMGISMLMMLSPPASEGDIDDARRVYLRHLAAVREKALANASAQRAHAIHHHPDPRELIAHIDTRRVWERAAQDPDALDTRIGIGDAALATPIEVHDSGATEDLDPVCAVSVRHLVQTVGTVPDMPVVLSLRAFRFLSVSGPAARGVGRAMVAQLVTAHGPETVGFEIRSADQREWEWTKWLPHTAEPRRARHRILIVDDIPTTGTEDFLDDDTITTIINISTFPAASDLILRAENEGLALDVDAAGESLSVLTSAGIETLGRPDQLTVAEALLLARRMTGLVREGVATSSGDQDLLSLCGVGDVESLTPETMWLAPRRGRMRLVVPIGATPEGVPVRLDLKESAQSGMGPHGLCIGATGSGKSELLRVIVTALALTHSPEDLNFVLVDFKGGATFLDAETLPHTSAVITNLDNEAILVERMYDAISGELNRRQELLRAAGNFANITDYDAARQQPGATLEPLPALLIIIDEFSELLEQHPDFAELFVAVGRLGRSLGVHLLLASQRLEEGKMRGLDSHLSYRIGLKTFSAAESRQVLGVTDAFSLPNRPGAGFLRFGPENLTRFQAAYASGPVARRDHRVPGAQLPAAVRPFVSMADDAARMSAPADTTADIRMDTSTTVLGAVVEAAREAALSRSMTTRKVWLDPLPARIELSAVAEHREPLDVTVGIIDRPYHQRQDPFVLPLASAGGHVAVCGGPQSGKTGTLRTIAASLSATHPTSKIRLYVIDFSSGELANLARLPHTAGYADRTDPERVRRIVDEATGFLDEPVDADVFVLIDGWHAVGTTGSDFEDLVEPITRLAADGPGSRVHLVISTPRWTVLRPSIRDLIAHRVELRLAEPMDSLIDRKAQQKIPQAPGRGVTGEGEQMLVAYTSAQDMAHISAQAEAQGYEQVPQLRVLPESLDLSSLSLRDGMVALGMGGANLETVYWDPGLDQHLLVIGSAGSGKSTALRTVMEGISELGRDVARMVILDPRRSHLGQQDESMVASYAASTSAIAQSLADTYTTLTSRLPDASVSAEALQARSWWSGPDIYLVIDDLDVVPESDLIRLAEFLPHARDIGLHVVIARRSGGIGRALYSGVISHVRDEQPVVIVLSADREEGTIFGVRPSTQVPGRGTWVRRSISHGIIQLARGEQQ